MTAAMLLFAMTVPVAPSPPGGTEPLYVVTGGSFGGLTATVEVRSESVSVLPATAPVAVALAPLALVLAGTAPVVAASLASGVAALVAAYVLALRPRRQARRRGATARLWSRLGNGADWRPD